MNISENLQALLDERQWTPERLAVASQEAGDPVEVPAIYAWLRGSRVPNGTSAVALANALGCTTDEILRGPVTTKAAS